MDTLDVVVISFQIIDDSNILNSSSNLKHLVQGTVDFYLEEHAFVTHILVFSKKFLQNTSSSRGSRKENSTHTKQMSNMRRSCIAHKNASNGND